MYLLNLLAPLIALYLVIMFHEFGHVFMGKRRGYRVSSVLIGLGGPFLILPFGGTRYCFGMSRFGGGITFALHRHLFTEKRDHIALLLGGAYGNLVGLILGLLCLWIQVPFPLFLLWFVGLNALMGITNLVSFQSEMGAKQRFTLRTDGGQIQALTKGTPEALPGTQIRNLSAVRVLLEVVGDTLQIGGTYLVMALQYVAIGDQEEAERLYRKGMEIIPKGDANLTMRCNFMRLLIFSEVSKTFVDDETMRQEWQGLIDHEEKSATSRLALSVLATTTQPPEIAIERLSSLLPEIVSLQQYALSKMTRSLLFFAYAKNKDNRAIAVFNELEEMEPDEKTPGALQRKHLMAEFQQSKGKTEKAGEQYKGALTVAGAIYVDLKEEALQEKFALKMQPLIDEAVMSALNRGDTKGAEEARQIFVSAQAEAKALEETTTFARNKIVKRNGIMTLIALMFIGIQVGVGLWLQLATDPLGLPSKVAWLTLLLSLITLFGIGAVYATSRKQKDAGAINLVLSQIPWLVSFIFYEALKIY